jgi:predicted nucleic acid-binding protein
VADFYFVDTSALAKRYILETGSAWLRGLINQTTGNKVFIVRTTAIEMIAAISRREIGGSLNSADAAAARLVFRADLASEYQVVELSATLANLAMHLAERHGLRGYDAIQLAAALEVNTLRTSFGSPPITLLSSDTELNTAAKAEGLACDDPNAHP